MYYPYSEKRALISCTVTAQLICAFVFAYAKSRISHDAAHLIFAEGLIPHLIAENNALKEEKADLDAEINSLKSTNAELAEANHQMDIENINVSGKCLLKEIDDKCPI